ncbi:MAG: type II toxin-antitoxin system RelE/ParE family toxin [Nitrospirota bacterium]|jgi:toxin ParE1/3/4|nr:type II toxin-antitoxin system RelE/ParE family toxin [Nitrospirota bacterium]MDX2420639.1 type II toxin-antitoxin system RelE/ParE family toxin [Nitrospirota bacterium]
MGTDFPVIFHYEAFAELEQTKSWYNQQAERLGEAFFQEVQLAISRIQHTPQTWPVYTHGTRRFLLHRFPFGIVYQHTAIKIHILAVMHLKRKPDYWKKRGA